MKQQKLSFSFHNPNTAEVTANYLLKLFVEVNRSKVDDAIRQAAQDLPELSACLFSTLIKCRDCGWSFRRTVRTYKKTYVRWVCSGHNGRGGCGTCHGCTEENCPHRK